MIFALSLAALVERCAPRVGPLTMTAVVVHESAAQPFAIGDNTARRSYFPPDRQSAIRLARGLIGAGHDLDLGYAQINVANLAHLRLDVPAAFEPCSNIAAGARLLLADYRSARDRFGPGQVALAHALSAYNSGGFYAAMGYAHDVYATARRIRGTVR